MKNALLDQLGLAFMRIVPSAMMLTHGYPKFQKLVAGDMEFADPIGIGGGATLFLAVIGECIAPIMILIGYKTRLAAVPVVLTMLVAAFISHGNDPFHVKEKALLYAVAFMAIMVLGPGKYSLDRG